MTEREYKIACMYINQIIDILDKEYNAYNNYTIDKAKYKCFALKKFLNKNTVPFKEPYTVFKKLFK